MRRHIYATALGLGSSVLLYLIFSFIAWEFNPALWGMAARYGLMVFSLAVIFFLNIAFDGFKH